MKNALTYKAAIGCMLTLFCYSLTAQHNRTSRAGNSDIDKANKRLGHYQELKNLGYGDSEIFEDLGNANFLSEKYETALFWYDKLKANSEKGELNTSYQKRYQYALEKTGAVPAPKGSAKSDWIAMVKKDYQMDGKSSDNEYAQSDPRTSKYKPLDFLQESDPFMDSRSLGQAKFEKMDAQNGYRSPIALTADGNTAYFSKATYVKPLYGIFSKKELVHKIYRADKVKGQWKNIKEVALCPKNYSSKHPAVSPDGKRLFFASDMPGTFGEYDIYVSAIRSDGSLGVAKNLGKKVNTKKNDLYPNIVDGNTLFFASEGRKGYGGLDIYMAEVGQRKVGLAMNLGSPINSAKDDFSISLMTDQGTGYVMSNRGKGGESVRRVAFSYTDRKKNLSKGKRDFNILEAFNNNLKIDYTSSVFEDE